MSEREMHQVRVATTKARKILISQEQFGEDDAAIIVSPEQVEALIQWLIEAKRELDAN